MPLDEIRDAGVAIDAGGAFEVGSGRVLVSLAKPHQRFVGPGIVVVDRNLQDPGRQRTVALPRRRLETLQFGEHIIGADEVAFGSSTHRGVGPATTLTCTPCARSNTAAASFMAGSGPPGP